MKIDFLQGLGVTKVECGSQFSVALTKSGAVYTWSVWASAARFFALISPTPLHPSDLKTQSASVDPAV